MPKPEVGEVKKDFMKRCVPELIEEGRQQSQAVAVCLSVFGKHNTVGDNSEEEYRKNKRINKMNITKSDKTKLYMLHY